MNLYLNKQINLILYFLGFDHNFEIINQLDFFFVKNLTNPFTLFLITLNLGFVGFLTTLLISKKIFNSFFFKLIIFLIFSFQYYYFYYFITIIFNAGY